MIRKILVFLLVFAVLNVLANIIDFALSWVRDEKFEKPLWKLIMLGISISYIFTIIFTGFSF